MILLGMTWPGKRVTGLNFILEFFPQNIQNIYITIFTEGDYPSIFIISLYYQFVNPNWLNMQLFGLALSLMCLFFSMIYMPESPKYLYVHN